MSHCMGATHNYTQRLHAGYCSPPAPLPSDPYRARSDRDTDCRDYAEEARPHETMIEQVPADPGCDAMVERHGGEQRAVGRQKEDAVGRRVEGDQTAGGEFQRQPHGHQDVNRSKNLTLLFFITRLTFFT